VIFIVTALWFGEKSRDIRLFYVNDCFCSVSRLRPWSVSPRFLTQTNLLVPSGRLQSGFLELNLLLGLQEEIG